MTSKRPSRAKVMRSPFSVSITFSELYRLAPFTGTVQADQLLEAICEIGLESCMMKCISFSLGHCPLTEFLGQPAVVGHNPCAEGELEFIGGGLQVGDHSCNFFRCGPEQLAKGLPIFRGFRIQEAVT